jgi:hypothetical protein
MCAVRVPACAVDAPKLLRRRPHERKPGFGSGVLSWCRQSRGRIDRARGPALVLARGMGARRKHLAFRATSRRARPSVDGAFLHHLPSPALGPGSVRFADSAGYGGGFDRTSQSAPSGPQVCSTAQHPAEQKTMKLGMPRADARRAAPARPFNMRRPSDPPCCAFCCWHVVLCLCSEPGRRAREARRAVFRCRASTGRPSRARKVEGANVAA